MVKTVLGAYQGLKLHNAQTSDKEDLNTEINRLKSELSEIDWNRLGEYSTFNKRHIRNLIGEINKLQSQINQENRNAREDFVRYQNTQNTFIRAHAAVDGVQVACKAYHLNEEKKKINNYKQNVINSEKDLFTKIDNLKRRIKEIIKKQILKLKELKGKSKN